MPGPFSLCYLHNVVISCLVNGSDIASSKKVLDTGLCMCYPILCISL